LQAYKNSVADLVEPITPKDTVEPRKFVNILLILIACQYLWRFCNQAARFIRISRHGLLPFHFLFYFQFINLVYVPVVFILVFKRRKWAWILLFADSLFTLVLWLSQILFAIEGYYYGVYYFYATFIRFLFAFVLWRPMIAEHFGITVSIKKKTLVIVFLIALLFLAFFSFSIKN